MIEEKVATLKALDSELIELVPEEDLEAEIQQADEHLERMYGVLAKLEKALRPSTTPTPAVRARTEPAARPRADTERPATPHAEATRPDEATRTPPEEPTPHADVTPRADSVKLPKIGLPHFNGDLMKWTPFWDSFDSAIHQNARLSEIDKFNYLRPLLEGTAYEAIAGLSLSALNYSEAVRILNKRFGNKQLIISKHTESLLAVNSVASDHHLQDLRKLYDQSESNIRSLKALGVEPESYGAMLSSVLLGKLPPDLRLIISRTVSTDELNVEHILETFERELVARERASNSVPHQARRTHNQGRTPTTSFLAGAQGSPECAFCGRSHNSVNCETVSDVDARKRILRNDGRCFNCLRKRHLSRNCPSKTKCRSCQGKHHTSICGMKTPSKEESGGKETPLLDPEAPTFTPKITTNTLCSTRGKAILLQTASTVAFNPLRRERATEVRILFDTGSQRSYVTEHATKLLQLKPTGEQTLSIATFGARQEQTRVCPIVSVGFRLKGYPDVSLSLHVVPTICEPLSSQYITATVKTHDQLKKLDLAEAASSTSGLVVDVLVGCDHYYWDFVTGKICRVTDAIHTKLGWVLSGPTPSSELVRHSSACITTTHLLYVGSQPAESAQLTEQLRSFWELESLGIEEEKTLYDEFKDRISFQDGRYQVPLPWKEFHEPLDDNYSLSVKRLKGLLKRLKHSPEILSQYESTIKDQLSKGVIEPVPLDMKTDHAVHYLPHHGVVREDKDTTKLRVVYDASSKVSGPSLNECLYKGPKFKQLILDIRFRSYQVALIADVEKAFLMIAVDENDRDVLRFIWVDVTKEDPELRIFRFTRVVFGVSSSPFLLNATVRHHLEQFLSTSGTTVQCLLRSTYVDDIVAGAKSEEEAFALYSEAKAIFRQGGLKFSTNSVTLQSQIDALEGLIDPAGVSPALKEDMKVLGVPWNPRDDSLMFELSSLSVVATEMQPTKRNVVSLVGRFYDPLGFLAPITIRFKILFQSSPSSTGMKT